MRGAAGGGCALPARGWPRRRRAVRVCIHECGVAVAMHSRRGPPTLSQLSANCKALEEEVARSHDTGVEPESSQALAQRLSQLEGTLEEIASSCGSENLSDGGGSSLDDENDDDAVVSRYFKSTKIFGASLKIR